MADQADMRSQSGTADRLERHVAWHRQRECARARVQERVLATLAAAVGDVERCAELAGPDQQLQTLLDRTLDRLQQALGELRGDASPLGGGPLDGSNLREGLERLAADAAAASMCHVDARIEPNVAGQLSPSQAAHVLYVVREALANALRHSGASRLALRASVVNRKLVVKVSDDGQGFDPQAGRPDSQQGLRKMWQRAEAVRALLGIESAQGAGTVVTLTISL